MHTGSALVCYVTNPAAGTLSTPKECVMRPYSAHVFYEP